MDKKILYIDMDGVLVDFYTPFLKEKSEKNPYPHSRVGFFIELEPYPGGIEAFNLLKEKYDVWILTAPSPHNIHCYTEKAEWVKKYLGFEALEKTILSTNKALLKGHYLIDDMTKNGQLEFEGIHLHFGSKVYPNWDIILNYLL